MNTPAYTIHVCDRCGTDEAKRGAMTSELLRHLSVHPARDQFRLATVRCMAGCDHPLAVGFTAPNKASYLFGKIDPARDADALVAFGQLYESLPDGWCNESARPVELRGKTLARIPCADGWTS